MERNVSSIGDPEAAIGGLALAEVGQGGEGPGPGFDGTGRAETGERAALSPRVPDPHLFLQVDNVTKSYTAGGRELRLFDGLSFGVREVELVAIVGQSGAGKSTLLHMLGALDAPTSGEVWCAATLLSTLTSKQAARFRNREVGYVWQFHYLLPEFTAAENVAMPLLAGGARHADALESAQHWLEQVGLGERVAHRAGELSGGEQQRVAIARALVAEPRLLLADEPTGDLDSETADTIFSLIENLHRTQKLTTVLVTHNMTLARRADRVMRLSAGRLEEVALERV
jgi:lipoprotein-releasing system ATP-binding protein